MADKNRLNRRTFVKQSFALASAFPLYHSLPWLATEKDNGRGVPLQWMGNHKPTMPMGLTWGVPWQQGELFNVDKLNLQENDLSSVTLQSWVTARWPDGSLKWTAHAVPAATYIGDQLLLTTQPKGANRALDPQLVVVDEDQHVTVDTGKASFRFNKNGDALIAEIRRGNKVLAKEGQLVLNVRNSSDPEQGMPMVAQDFISEIAQVEVEQRGPIRAVIKVTGSHQSAEGRQLLPFVVRFYIYAAGESMRVVHSIVYDADEQQDFISGLGLRFTMPLTDELYNRHVRFCGADEGVFGEAVKGLTGLRRDPGKSVRDAQVAGKATPPEEDFHPSVKKNIHYIATFGDYTLLQPNPEGFEIRKRTKKGHAWLQSAFGQRAAGVGYLGGPSGGVAFGIRNFWKSFPAQLDIRHAETEQAQVTLWLWAPDAQPMDLRFYHDGMGQDTHQKQLDALDINYEDYEPGFGTPHGVARTSEMELWALDHTPAAADLTALAAQINEPPLLVCQPAYYHDTGIFGGAFSPVNQQDATEQAIEEQLAFYIEYYKTQIEQHKWYGFWNYGDVMHSYDRDRHMWRYDVGGFAWDNSELSTDLWLWYYFLRTGRYDVFRMAEAMTRHTGEVDVHHIGPFSPLGSRHNVQHWGCSAKQLRISTVANRRFYYYLTADERIGDLMREQLDAAATVRRIVPGRKIGQRAADKEGYASIGFGTDWGALAAAWFTEWERTADKRMRARLENSMRTIAAQPRGFFTGVALMDLETGEFSRADSERISVSHLSAAFGLPEICTELIENFDIPEFSAAWLQYCRLYNASETLQQEELGKPLGKLNLAQGHSKLTAYAARKLSDKELGQRAWAEFYAAGAGMPVAMPTTHIVIPPDVLAPVMEAPVSTNAAAQWGLAAMQCLAFIGSP
ncbi:exo-rhamnogalacturonan lyase family protein [Parapedobacter tibetensis]|uniref:exo-rhamnogalacturonan lyase family protein n=1 Tax=Parapedobacter tibetensis TaxID=2972951 RepID=UPI00214D855E|nr:hypothetical protein [Parapedobacter tibetensis]